MFEIVGFWFFAILSVCAFCVSVFSQNVLYAMCALSIGLIFIAGLFFTLGAEFLGVVQIAVYTGGVMVLYGFAMMFFDVNKKVKEIAKFRKAIVAICLFCAILMSVILFAPLKIKIGNLPDLPNSVLIGNEIFGQYLVAFEMVAVLLLVALICAVVLTHKEMDRKTKEQK